MSKFRIDILPDIGKPYHLLLNVPSLESAEHVLRFDSLGDPGVYELIQIDRNNEQLVAQAVNGKVNCS